MKGATEGGLTQHLNLFAHTKTKGIQAVMQGFCRMNGRNSSVLSGFQAVRRVVMIRPF